MLEGEIVIPDSYELKRIIRAHRPRFWFAELLDGFEFAPIWHFTDQAQFDSDEVNALARRFWSCPGAWCRSGLPLRWSSPVFG